MRDWSKLFNQISNFSYEDIVKNGKKLTNELLKIIEDKTEDYDSAFMILSGLCALSVTADNVISEMELRLLNDILGIGERDFKEISKQVQNNPAFTKELSDGFVLLDNDEVEQFATLLALIFAVDGECSEEEYAFIRDICR